MSKRSITPHPMLKEFLNSPPAAVNDPQGISTAWWAVGALVALMVGFMSDKWPFGVVAFVLFAVAISSLNEHHLKKRPRREQIERAALKESRFLRSVLEHGNPGRCVEPTVLASLESLARLHFEFLRRLDRLPEGLQEIVERGSALSASYVRLAILAAKPLIRREGQARSKWEAITEDKALIASVIAQVDEQAQRVKLLKNEVEEHGQEPNVGLQLRSALEERRKAEAELDGLHLDLG